MVHCYILIIQEHELVTNKWQMLVLQQKPKRKNIHILDVGDKYLKIEWKYQRIFEIMTNKGTILSLYFIMQDLWSRDKI